MTRISRSETAVPRPVERGEGGTGGSADGGVRGTAPHAMLIVRDSCTGKGHQGL
jgi:hypothetical protein